MACVIAKLCGTQEAGGDSQSGSAGCKAPYACQACHRLPPDIISCPQDIISCPQDRISFPQDVLSCPQDITAIRQEKLRLPQGLQRARCRGASETRRSPAAPHTLTARPGAAGPRATGMRTCASCPASRLGAHLRFLPCFQVGNARRAGIALCPYLASSAGCSQVAGCAFTGRDAGRTPVLPALLPGRARSSRRRCAVCLIGPAMLVMYVIGREVLYVIPRMRFCASRPACASFVCPAQVVEAMRRGVAPREAAEQAIARIARYVPSYFGALVAVDKRGNHAGAAFGCACPSSSVQAGHAP